MKLKSFLCLAVAATCFAASSSQAALNIAINAADLRNNTGTTLMPVGGLLELVADTSRNGFSLPTAGASVPTGGDDIVIAKFSLNGAINGAGTTQNNLNINTAAFPGLDLGDPLLLRWFPNTQFTTTAEPAGGAMFGQFRTDTIQTADGSSIAWAYPAEGGTYTLNFITASEGGGNLDALGFATLTVVGVPEPSTWATFGVGAVGLAAYGLRRRQATV